ncbi:hypothetical protein COR50_09940 [Chitinophaga caeni]|uniref:Lipid/polyisoprenoid-binding YceI-like domain-containing protein n=1 Tax=Chitinophaga caeni TaxID=2029983 RepID=A0A291QU32_9BACT|nr:YceI family protein [Chitinophaga caeni]ATL47470.1 hypothetical protein COR50_09940 [Chitinophaga caeni]
MKKLLLALVAFAPLALFAQKTTWKADPAHTSVNFSVNHLGISQVAGKFEKFDGTVVSSNKDFTGAQINFTVDVNSVNTGVDQRDTHLKSDDFFNAAKFPEMKFTGTAFKKISDDKYLLVGDLTIRDVTKTVTFEVVHKGGIIVDPWGNNRAGFIAKTKINRFDFNINYGKDNTAVGKEVRLVINLEIVQQKS